MGRFHYDWAAIAADEKFQALNRRKNRFLALLMVVSIAAYLALPVGAAYFPELFATPVFGTLNVGLLVAFGEFVIAGLVAYIYTRRANADFDRAAKEISTDAVLKYARRNP